MGKDSAAITELLLRWSQGDRDALRDVVPLMYEELRRVARSHLRRQRNSRALQTGELVNEAYLRLVNERSIQVQGRLHFVGIAAQAMRWILVDHERNRLAAKRGGGQTCLSLNQGMHIPEPGAFEVDVLALDQALERLAQLDQEQSRIVELRYFGGLSIEETAEYLERSPATVKRAWASARAWLLRELSQARGEAGP